MTSSVPSPPRASKPDKVQQPEAKPAAAVVKTEERDEALEEERRQKLRQVEPATKMKPCSMHGAVHRFTGGDLDFLLVYKHHEAFQASIGGNVKQVLVFLASLLQLEAYLLV